MHIVSGVQGQLEAGRDAFDLFAAAFPAGTLVGAPKVRAMELIDENEPQRRGLYGGTVGYFAHGGGDGSGDCDPHTGIRQRPLQLSGRRRHRCRQRARAEYEEVLAKSAILQRALFIAGEGL